MAVSWTAILTRQGHVVGVPAADVGACLAAIRHLDVSRTLRSSAAHETCIAENAPAQNLERYRELREELRAPERHVAKNAAWYTDYVMPLRELTPEECSDQHVADTTLDALKAELDALLRASGFYSRYLLPLERTYNSTVATARARRLI